MKILIHLKVTRQTWISWHISVRLTPKQPHKLDRFVILVWAAVPVMTSISALWKLLRGIFLKVMVLRLDTSSLYPKLSGFFVLFGPVCSNCSRLASAARNQMYMFESTNISVFKILEQLKIVKNFIFILWTISAIGSPAKQNKWLCFFSQIALKYFGCFEQILVCAVLQYSHFSLCVQFHHIEVIFLQENKYCPNM